MRGIILKNIRKTFMGGRILALDDIELEIPEGRFVGILGPSGCGKTTLLRIIAGLEKPDIGEIYINNRRVDELKPHERNIAMVFQNYALYPHMKVYKNIAIGLKLRGVIREDIEKKVRAVSEMLGISELLDRYPKQLSGGQQQRVALARAIVRNPSVFLLDEPLSNLDASLRESTRSELKRLFKKLEATVIYVTHDQIEAMTMADILVVMKDGKIIQLSDPISIYNKPIHRFVGEFIGSPKMNIISGYTERGFFVTDDAAIYIPVKFDYYQRVDLGVRPQDICILDEEPPENIVTLKGKLVLIEPLGGQYLLTVTVGNNEVRLLSSEKPGKEDILISFDPDNLHFFDSQEGYRI
jgi:multiple sugar transport system ATP-binding protein